MDYLSPDRLQSCLFGSTSKIDEEKNDVFAIGIMSLEMLGKKIKGLNNN